MAKGLSVTAEEHPFIEDSQTFAEEGKHVAREVLELQGGYNGLTAQLPLDRGDANHSLVLLCNAIADAVESQTPDLAASLRAEAFKVGSKARPPGTPRQAFDISGLLKSITDGWTKLSTTQKQELKAEGELIGDLSAILDTRRVLFVHSNPQDSEHLRLTGELRTVKRTIQSGEVNTVVHDLPAATVDDLRTELLHSTVAYDVVHFSGHADADNLIFEDENNQSHPVSLAAIADLLSQKNVVCVILNACSTLQSMKTAIAPYTIGLSDDLEDESATAFSRGFYDALSVGKKYDEAFREGVTAVKLKGGSADNFKLLTL
jgi:hypothetical protein